jgi:anti-sigma regulatory factor (Ser/Thr protein kinase)
MYRQTARPGMQYMDDNDALLSLRLPSRPEAVSAARKALASLNGDLHLVSSERLQDVQLLASELVTNAIRHSERDDVSVVVRSSATMLRVEVANAGAAFDEVALPEPSHETAGGWGLRIVELIAHRWGVDPSPDGVQVWFEVDRPRSDTPLAITGEAPPPS